MLIKPYEQSILEFTTRLQRLSNALKERAAIRQLVLCGECRGQDAEQQLDGVFIDRSVDEQLIHTIELARQEHLVDLVKNDVEGGIGLT